MADDIETARKRLIEAIVENTAHVRRHASRPTLIPDAAIDALVAAVRAENAQVRIAADEWQKCARAQATMVEELCERVDVLERKLADISPELR